MVTKKKTNTEKVYNALATKKAVKLTTLAKKLYGNTESTSISNARRFVNKIKETTELNIKLVDVGTYKAY